MANNNDLSHVFKALDDVLAQKDSEIFHLQYRVEDLERKLAEAEASKKPLFDDLESAIAEVRTHEKYQRESELQEYGNTL